MLTSFELTEEHPWGSETRSSSDSLRRLVLIPTSDMTPSHHASSIAYPFRRLSWKHIIDLAPTKAPHVSRTLIHHPPPTIHFEISHTSSMPRSNRQRSVTLQPGSAFHEAFFGPDESIREKFDQDKETDLYNAQMPSPTTPRRVRQSSGKSGRPLFPRHRYGSFS